ncbi:hypothetical protein SAMN05720761_107112 [Fibrobacter sp. UWCM]|nr:LEPR-XLL domain-containing protein [Fibrobacter sp. UWCM]SHH01095.1 hypothetical protein SAMN05720761_107112 [Fibrobacter sp. UWCM]
MTAKMGNNGKHNNYKIEALEPRLMMDFAV